MKKLILIALALVLSGCGWFDQQVSSVTGGASKICVDGVEYLQFTSGATVAYNTDGTIKVCK